MSGYDSASNHVFVGFDCNGRATSNGLGEKSICYDCDGTKEFDDRHPVTALKVMQFLREGTPPPK
jgi:hypothetical protein